ncbi:MAG TPA: hypothetical protein VFH48_23085, partial [Chloroflexota bacterium]|nr:hypothetical protein [Chloroflexota bacterium]
VIPNLRPSLLLSLSVIALLLTCAALDGPVVRYRYPADPLIALVGAGAVTWAFAWLRSRLAGRVRSVEAPRVSQPLAAPTAGRASGGV